MSSGKQSVIWDQTIYLITGIATTLLGQQLSYLGAANKFSLLPVAMVYLGMASVWLLPSDKNERASTANDDAAASKPPNNMLSSILMKLPPRITIMLVALGDIVSNAVCFIAMVMAGSGMFQVIYSSILIFVAIQARLILGTRISPGAIIWIGVVSAGLAIAALAPAPAAAASAASSASISTGALLMCVLGVVMYSVQYIVYECALHLPSLRLTGKALCIQVGMYGSAITLTYVALYTVPNFQALIYEPMAAAAAAKGAVGGIVPSDTWSTVIALYLVVLICHCAHNITYFNLVGSPSGAMGAGIMQALRAVGVFGLSSYFFCSVQAAQCFDAWKGASTAVVVVGVLGYSKYK